MRAAAAADLDPNGDGCISPDAEAARLQNHTKKELIDKIQKTIEVEVETRNGVHHTVRVVPSWRERSVLQLELTHDNLNLLLEEPRPEAAPPVFTPRIDQPNVVWVNARTQVRCKYWISKKKKWKTTSRPIDFDSDMDDDQKQDVVNREAMALQDYFDANHDRAGELQDCLTGSAESACDEPRVKKTRTEASFDSYSMEVSTE